MSRKRNHDSDKEEEEADSGSEGSRQQDSDEDMEEKEIVDVDFEFFDPKPIDFHSMKQMLVGSFGDDAEDFNLSGLVDLILSQNTIGSTVKVEGDENPYAFLTVLNMHVHRDKEPIQQIKQYLLKKAEKKKGGQDAGKIIDILNGPGHVGLLLNERVVNMPAQVTAPMLKMLVEELEWAVADGEPYEFEYYMLLAPMYRETEAVDDDDEEKVAKRPTPAVTGIDAYGHGEDEFIEEFACAKFDYKFSRSKRVAESRNSFADTGLAPSRRCLVIHKSKIAGLIQRLEAVLAM
ncbi:Mss4p nuclear export [Coemansia sp. BCRC 34301]|nr:Mss4p nuclear export [Coemansia sp. BCRC 34301]